MSKASRKRTGNTRFSTHHRSVRGSRAPSAAERPDIQSPSTAWCITPGDLIDTAIVLGLIGFWLMCGPHDRGRGIFDVVVPVSLSGTYVVGRRLLSSNSALPHGIRMWGAHGLVGLVAVGVFMTMQDATGARHAESIAQSVLTFCLGALIVQVLIGLVAVIRLIHQRPQGIGDVVGTTVCVAYAFVMSGWALLVFE